MKPKAAMGAPRTPPPMSSKARLMANTLGAVCNAGDLQMDARTMELLRIAPMVTNISAAFEMIIILMEFLFPTEVSLPSTCWVELYFV